MNIARWEEARDHIHECLLSEKWHRPELQFCIKVPVAADVYKVFLVDKGTGQRAYVTRALIKYWGVTMDDVALVASRNNAGYSVSRITDFLGGMFDIDCPDHGLYICTNHDGSFGAAAILNKDVQRQLSEIFPEGFYCLPSSIHEFIATSAPLSPVANLAKMVSEINRTCVAESDRLSDHVFMIKDGQLAVVA